MPRSRAVRLSHRIAKGACRRLGAWLGVFALALQMLVPLAQPQAAWIEEGLFPPTCSVHSDVGAADPSQSPDCGQCVLCPGQLGTGLGSLSDRSVSAAFDGTVTPVAPPPRSQAAAVPPSATARPPLPSRGPPAAA